MRFIKDLYKKQPCLRGIAMLTRKFSEYQEKQTGGGKIDYFWCGIKIYL